MRCAKCGSETPIGHRCIMDDLEAIRNVDLSDHPLFKREAEAAPEPREDVAVAEVLARVLLMHQDTYEDAPLIRCMCGERLLTLTEHVHHVATMQHVETAPLIAERERAAAVEAWERGYDSLGSRTANPYRTDRRAER